MNRNPSSGEQGLGSLSKNKTELLRFLLEKESRERDKIKPYPRGNATPDLRLPLSWAQERLWFIDKLEAGSAGYNMPMAVHFHGALNRDAMAKALNTLPRRHEVLRTVFESVDGSPAQIVLSDRNITIREFDLRVYDKVERDEQVQVHEKEEAEELFDLRKGPLIRGRILRLLNDEHILLISMHHIVSDGWSMGLFIREFAELFRAYQAERDDPLEPLPLQYADYALWQREWLKGERLEKQLAYWRAHLKGAPYQLELPTDRARPAIQSYQGGNVAVTLNAELTRKLKLLGQRHDMTLFMTLFAGWAILLSRLANQDDLVVGTPIANRPRPELERLIGFFVNTLALRVKVQSDSLIETFLRSVREVILGAYSHQDAPFEKVVEALQPQRSLSRNPIFQVMIALQNSPKAGAIEFPGLVVIPEDRPMTLAKFDLLLSLEERGGEILGYLNYAADLFDRDTVVRWVECFQTVLNGMITHPQRRIGDLPILPRRERQQIIDLFSAPPVASSSDRLIHQLFEAQVDRTPGSIAVVHDGRQLSYRELNEKANRLAVFLREKGVGPDQLVGICVDRTLEMVVGLLGILKAGGAYVPLDPAYPSDRLTFMLKDAAPRVLLTQESLRNTFHNTGTEPVTLDTDWDEIMTMSEGRPAPQSPPVSSRHLAYVIYTSGSTGEPKGVMVEHGGVVNFLTAMQESPGISGTDRMLAITTISFDIAALEIYLPLISGATLVVASQASVADPQLLMSMLDDSDITIMQATPATWQMLLSAGWTGRSNLRTLCGGEALSADLCKRLGPRVASLFNLYGPTESTIWSCCRQIVGSRDAAAIESIGRPIANTQVYILDSHFGIVPIGVAGEIYIGGAGVARGYRNRPALTAERFLPNPFHADSNARLYKTGDVGRWRSDGVLDYLGRNDQQVKIRGFRIELEEIEHQLTRNAAVKDAVVIAREDQPGDKRIVAYVIPERDVRVYSGSDRATEKLRKEIVTEWEAIWRVAYSTNYHTDAPGFAGWNSSYTGEPIPECEMQEWLTNTIQRIKRLGPTRILEIGCGMGLLLQHLAPESTVYVGTDLSNVALEQLSRWMSRRGDLKHVRLLHRSATELEEFKPGSFDMVVLNSVVQYFPDIDYLIEVLRESARLVSPGGKIFIGDVRCLGLLTMFHSALQLSKAGAAVTIAKLKRRIAQAVAQEKELVIDPQFFQMLPGHLPGVSAVEVQLKRGRALNELTRYRYDVVLYLREHVTPSPICVPIEWPLAGQSAEFETALSNRQWRAVRLMAIPNLRLAKEAAAQKLIQASDERLATAAIRREVDCQHSEGIDPEEIWSLGEAYGYDVCVSWSTKGAPGSFDVQLLDRGRATEVSRAVPEHDTLLPWHAYANDPLESKFKQHLIPTLREQLRLQLPEYMLPSAWVTLRELPLTPNRKLDRRALPAPEGRPEEMGEYIAPRTEMERTLADVWANILRVDQVGASDNFFELGGHSLLIVQMMERLRTRGLSTEVRRVFENPTLADLALTLKGEISESIAVPPNLIPLGCEQIKPQMLPLVELEPQHIDLIAATVPGGAANIQDIYPLVPLQEGLLFHHLLADRGGDTYVLPMLFCLSSPQRLEQFIQALQAIIARYDILRTAIRWEHLPRAVQVVYRRAELPVEEVQGDWGHDPVSPLKAMMRPDGCRLELQQAPLMLLKIVSKTQTAQCYALLMIHHLIADQESLDIMLAEVTSHLQGRAQYLPTPTPYRNHVAQVLNYAQRSAAEAFFKLRLGDIDEPTAPFGLWDVHGNGTRFDLAREALEPSLALRVVFQARRMGVTPATLFHAAWALVVSHTSGRDDVVYGTVLLGRMHGSADTRRTLGMFINTLPLRIRLTTLTARDLVEQTQRELVELMTYDRSSLAIAQRCSAITGSAPLFSALLNYRHRSADPETDVLGAAGVTLLASRGGTNYPFVFSVDDYQESFSLQIETDQRIDPTRILGYVTTALESLVAALERDPTTLSLALPLLPEHEKHRTIELFNSHPVISPNVGLLHELFEERVRSTPHSVALLYERQSLTFAQLNGRANQLARYLRERAVGPDQLVGLYIEPSLNLVVGLLGILKAGGVYLPLDPTYPPERLEYMLKDAAPAVLLTHNHLKHTLPGTAAEVIALDNEWHEIARRADINLHISSPHLTSRHLAYVIYTSGSTGEPKGVAAEHRAILNRIAAQVSFDPIFGDDICCQKTSIGFVDSVFEILGPLSYGRPLVIASATTAKDVRELASLIERRQITRLVTVPSLAQSLIENVPTLDSLCSLHKWTLSGEELPEPLLRKLQRALPQCTFTNIYGCSEIAADATYCTNTIPSGKRLPIGHPMPNVRIYVLNPHMRPVPIGVTGEIYVGGLGVARGYLNRPDLTASRFLADPFCQDTNARLYKTGDLGRWTPDGILEYLGRNDQQVKIRGYRIELGEIEVQLARHQQVRQAAVIAREDIPGNKRLVAYLTVHDRNSVSAENMRAHLASVLPEYMIPSAFVFLDSLPRTTSGKVNHRDLPPPGIGAFLTRSSEAPQGEVEELLAELWQQLLNVERVGRHDNFFELGGHSLHAVKFVAKISERFTVPLTVAAIFRSPTVRELAELVNSGLNASGYPGKTEEVSLQEGVF